jgi:acyl-CoA dehydrogenase
MKLFNPKKYVRDHADDASREIVLKTIDFFENKGLKRIKEDDQKSVWYEDFLEFIKKEKVFATLLTPAGCGTPDARWDMWRISEFNEVLSFYGLAYWYVWQVSILGLGPIWMSQNQEVKERAAHLLQEGGIFAFGLSEQKHGADIYSTAMTLFNNGDGSYLAEGNKYYIGNGNCAALVSTFAKMDDTNDYVFFVVETDHPRYECVQKIETSGVRQAFVSEYALQGYPIRDQEILSRGKEAWNAALNTVNIGKYQLGMASVGIATHCLYEAINHAGHRVLYGQHVTDFPHVRQAFTEAYCRLVAAKLFAWRAADYMRAASPEDRRYLLFNPVVKMKVTRQGDQVVSMLHEIIAARGYEQKDTYFEMAIREVGMLPRLEGTEQVNMALIIKFIKNYLFDRQEFPEVGHMKQAGNDAYLFNQQTGNLSQVRFPDYRQCYAGWDEPNINVFREQMELYRELLMKAPPTKEQSGKVDYLFGGGELFTLMVYAQLILENAKIYNVDKDVLNEIFTFLVQDFSAAALRMITHHGNTADQEAYFHRMLKKPHRDEGAQRVWQDFVFALRDEYEMNP